MVDKLRKLYSNIINMLKNIKATDFLIHKYFETPEELKGNRNIYMQIATFFGCGYFKKAPGTFTSFVAILIGIVLVLISHYILFLFTLLVVIAGFISTDKVYSKENPDPGYIVIDEVAGQLLPFLIVNNTSILNVLLHSVLIFVIFRILDIYKPWIIGKSETSFNGGVAIMIDDLIAGLFTLFAMFIVLLFG